MPLDVAGTTSPRTHYQEVAPAASDTIRSMLRLASILALAMLARGEIGNAEARDPAPRDSALRWQFDTGG